MTQAYDKNGRLIQGVGLEKQLIADYERVHCKLGGFSQEEIQFPRVEMSLEHTIGMMKNVSQKKTGGMDGVACQWFQVGCSDCPAGGKFGNWCQRCAKKVSFCWSLANLSNYWRSLQSKKHHIARLIPLNKDYPRVPQIGNYRAIAVQTNVRKFWEGRLVPKLRAYVNEKLNKSQFGFKAGTGIEHCRNEVLKYLIDCKKIKNPQMLLFIDMSKAYDSVDQQRLVRLIERKEILDQYQIKLLKWLLANSVVRFGQSEVRATTGVPQGSTLSPYLFNIYAEELLEKLDPIKKVKSFMYADDLLITTPIYKSLDSAINVVKRWCQESNMVINYKKSGLMDCNWKKDSDWNREEYENFPFVDQYKYLGGVLTRDLKVEKHIAYITRKVDFLTYKFIGIRVLKNLRLNINLFRTFCLPLFMLGGINAWVSTRPQSKLFVSKLKMSFKRFCMLPKCTPNSLVKQFLGQPLELVEKLVKKVQADNMIKGLARTNGKHEGGIEQKKMTLVYFKHLPLKTLQLLNLLYRRQCREHAGTFLSIGHLRIFHGLRINLVNLIRKFQGKKQRRQVNERIMDLIKQLAPLGRRFPKVIASATEHQDSQQ